MPVVAVPLRPPGFAGGDMPAIGDVAAERDRLEAVLGLAAAPRHDRRAEADHVLAHPHPEALGRARGARPRGGRSRRRARRRRSGRRARTAGPFPRGPRIRARTRTPAVQPCAPAEGPAYPGGHGRSRIRRAPARPAPSLGGALPPRPPGRSAAACPWCTQPTDLRAATAPSPSSCSRRASIPRDAGRLRGRAPPAGRLRPPRTRHGVRRRARARRRSAAPCVMQWVDGEDLRARSSPTGPLALR